MVVCLLNQWLSWSWLELLTVPGEPEFELAQQKLEHLPGFQCKAVGSRMNGIWYNLVCIDVQSSRYPFCLFQFHQTHSYFIVNFHHSIPQNKPTVHCRLPWPSHYPPKQTHCFSLGKGRKYCTIIKKTTRTHNFLVFAQDSGSFSHQLMKV